MNFNNIEKYIGTIFALFLASIAIVKQNCLFRAKE